MDKSELIFNIYKDTVIVSKKFKREVKEKYGLNDVEASDMFVKITNYNGRLDFMDKDTTKEDK